MSLWELVFAACMIVAGFAAVWCTVVAWVGDWRARRREAAREALYACCLAVAADGEHDVWCPHRPAVGRVSVVASDDLDPLERLYAAPAYGEEHAS